MNSWSFKVQIGETKSGSTYIRKVGTPYWLWDKLQIDIGFWKEIVRVKEQTP